MKKSTIGIINSLTKILNKKFKVTSKIEVNSDISSLGLDSLDLMDLVLDIESKYNIHISDDELMNLKKIQDLIDIIERENNANYAKN